MLIGHWQSPLSMRFEDWAMSKTQNCSRCNEFTQVFTTGETGFHSLEAAGRYDKAGTDGWKHYHSTVQHAPELLPIR